MLVVVHGEINSLTFGPDCMMIVLFGCACLRNEGSWPMRTLHTASHRKRTDRSEALFVMCRRLSTSWWKLPGAMVTMIKPSSRCEPHPCLQCSRHTSHAVSSGPQMKTAEDLMPISVALCFIESQHINDGIHREAIQQQNALLYL